MKIFNEIPDLKKEYKNIAMALGMFDGMHLGHQSIVGRAMELAKETNGKSAVLTFQNHPMSVLDVDCMPLAIGTPYIRAKIIENMGADILIDIPFTKEFSLITPLDFLSLLKEKLAPKYVVVGKNFTFGRGGVGDGDLLIKEGKNFGFKAEVCKTVLNGNKPISSTRIRALIKEGNLEETNNFLGRPFSYIGEVIHGDERGRKIGFPTANLKIEEKRATLPNGAYAVKIKYEDKVYKGMANIGNNPTFDLNEKRIEVNIFNFSKNIYGEKIEIMFVKKLRDEVKFESVEKLTEALRNDKKRAEEIFEV
ncbi:MAG: bifunctional riboflavin kinase/FAD synthetase [Selenomonadaceae bacterium]|nr:bifunctional riboflavin kinase/FAD synthetase [Selenomonadaceae bacterium]